MPHHVYHTRALVMRSSASGEADVALELFTEEWGRIIAHARGLRRETSRLRYVLQPMNWVLASIVRGSSGWRLTTANPDTFFVPRGSGRRSLARVSRIVQRFHPYEVAAPQTFSGLLGHTRMLVEEAPREKDWEILTLARLFHHLGYWKEAFPGEMVSGGLRSDEHLSEKERVGLVREINRILRTVET